MSERETWIGYARTLAEPVWRLLAARRLMKELPPIPGREDRTPYAPSEAFCRSFAGLAPWIELGLRNESVRAELGDLIGLASEALAAGMDPDSPDFFPFGQPGQPLVEAAFLAHGLFRAPTFWQSLDARVQEQTFQALASTRVTTPPRMNWLLFTGIVEAFLACQGQPYEQAGIDDALDEHERWYKGDGAYGDGPWFHHDYYNSFVIQPMLIDILDALNGWSGKTHPMTEAVHKRFVRYAAVQERMISPEGTFPPIGRSLAYRFGVFQHLAQAALQERLPDGLAPSQVRSALSCVIKRSLAMPGTFTDDGFLNIGIAGHQPSVGEHYISRGSCYLCCTALLPLGLPPEHPFWSGPDMDWTARRVWSGQDIAKDEALHDP